MRKLRSKNNNTMDIDLIKEWLDRNVLKPNYNLVSLMGYEENDYVWEHYLDFVRVEDLNLFRITFIHDYELG